MDAKRTQNPADRALIGVRAAVVQLALLLGDEDPATVEVGLVAAGDRPDRLHLAGGCRLAGTRVIGRSA